jgi:hypothetical protein
VSHPGNLPVNEQRRPNEKEMRAVRHDYENEHPGSVVFGWCKHCGLSDRASVHS